MRANVLIRNFGNCSVNLKTQHRFALIFTAHTSGGPILKRLSGTLKLRTITARLLMGYGKFCSASGVFVECDIDSFDTVRRRYI